MLEAAFGLVSFGSAGLGFFGVSTRSAFRWRLGLVFF
jgi:hypothetical protein